MPEGAESETTTVFLMDSLNLHDPKATFDHTQRFLREMLDIHSAIMMKEVEVLHQGDNVDCALFSLYNIQKIITQVRDELLLEEIIQVLSARPFSGP
ncbi:hypothetical protein CFC21_033318 [Triticum aestivum]|uniref:Uncharacterized protein n=3 Tax=Triticum TaxID=4564 RepID=A0A3B6E9K0_WHEAT|nr:hypothetical protein TRIUR3_28112 [Triticum urartu]KAF7020195.1 hypothetical protein CFC21_033318 [Triticum aestivum]